MEYFRINSLPWVERTNLSYLVLMFILEPNVDDSGRQLLIPDDRLIDSIATHVEVFQAPGETAQADRAGKAIAQKIRDLEIFW